MVGLEACTCRLDEVREKLARVRDFLARERLDAVWFRRADNFAWITAGGNAGVNSASTCGVASVLVTKDAARLVTSRVEVDRIFGEELAPHGVDSEFEPLVHEWWDDPTHVVEAAVGPETLMAVDRGHMAASLAELRTPLTRWEAQRYPEIGAGVSGVVEEICFGLVPGCAEREVAGRLWGELVAAGFAPTVVLVGADERMLRYRHQVPTGAKVRRACMVVVCASQGGLTVALTRTVSFGRPEVGLARAHGAAAAVFAAMAAACRHGASYAGVWDAAVAEYAAQGWPGQWESHHQGGPISYGDREFLLDPRCEGRPQIAAPTAMAFNPSVPGGKSEDTFLVTEEGRLPVTVSLPEWPQSSFNRDGLEIFRPDVLVL